MTGRRKIDFSQLPTQQRPASGRHYWRTLEELADSDAFREIIEREFPEQAAEWTNATTRRRFLKLMAASLSLAGLGLSGCGRLPTEKIVPYVKQPEDIIPGKPLYFATAMVHDGAAVGLLVESHEGRPTKIEGNPDHPASLGATDIFAQAETLSLYDPDRSQTVRYAGRISNWNAALTALKTQLETQQLERGAGLRILTETIASPTLLHQLQRLKQRFPEAQWHEWDPVNRDNSRAGIKAAFGETLDPVYDFARADVVLSLDADFLTNGPGHLRNARRFMSKRSTVSGGDPKSPASMNRLYVVESTPSTTGGLADHRLPLRAGQIPALAQAIAASVGVSVPQPPSKLLAGVPTQWIAAVADDLKTYCLKNRTGAAVVLAGDAQPPVVHTLVAAMNEALGAAGKTVDYIEPPTKSPSPQMESLKTLTEDMRNGKVKTLIVLGGNPVFTAPADVAFHAALKKVPFRLHLGREYNETSAACNWHVDEAHFLESWSDARAHDGTVALVQPLIAPLYGGKTSHELLAVLLDEAGKSSHDVVRDHWKQKSQATDFDTFWQTALHDGIVPDTRSKPKSPVFRQQALANVADDVAGRQPTGKLEIVFRPDPTIWDGRYANSGWLQELPKPLTKLTWDNAALISVATAKKHGVQNGDVVALKRGSREIEIPVWVLPGHPDDSVTVHFGYGRTRVGRVGKGAGVNAYPLRTSEALWFAEDGELQKRNRTRKLAATHTHHLMGGRELILAGTIDELRNQPEHPPFMKHAASPERDDTLLTEWKYDGYKWGMSINLNACTGCNACVVACQSENNIPVVGKEEVINGREMHWIRIDTYYEGPAENPVAHNQPVPCMHCEKAPCEIVCPVGATVHSSEGLNEMVYNRCVGTRYCSNNCPYKVRRFNFLQFTDYNTPVLKLLNNPDVTVRSRGVMEKCTYCVQRISHAKIDAEKRTPPGGKEIRIRDGDLHTACQQVCPTEAIVFGDLNTKGSRVAKLQSDPLNYALLGELNTRPRTTYLAAVRNPNPRLEKTERERHV